MTEDGAARGLPARILGTLHGAEDVFLAVVLGLMVLLPLLEIALRALFHVGIQGSSALVQHLTLVAGMAGGALASREGRLLSLAADTYLPEGPGRRGARILSGGGGAAVALVLARAGAAFVASEAEAGKVLAYGVPYWAFQLAIPAGFALVALRLLRRAGDGWLGRLIASALCAALLAAAWWAPGEPLRLPFLAGILVLTALGLPIFAVLGGAALVLFWSEGVPAAAVSVEHYRMATNPTLAAIPLFTLAGYFLAEGGASRRLTRLFSALFGRFRGGPAVVATLVCAFFTSFTGASGVTILALGGLLLPILTAARLSEREAVGLLTAAGSLGLLFPPCLPPILYAIVAQVPMERIYLGGLLPGFLMVAVTAWWGVRRVPKREGEAPPFDGREAWRAGWDAKWELLLPAVALGTLLGGIATAVEAAALTALYAFVVETFFYRDLTAGKDIVRVAKECGLLVGGVLMILGVALGLTNYLVDAQVPGRAAEWVAASVHTKWLFLLLLNLLLVVVGCLMDIFSAIVVVVPLIVPIGAAFGVDPVHLGVIFLINLELGYLTPPVGMNLFLASYRFGKPVPYVAAAALPYLLIRLAAVLLVTYLPFLSTALPAWLGR